MSQDYEFEVTISAVVRVRAESESLAREVVASSALASPSADDIRLANEAEFIRGKKPPWYRSISRSKRIPSRVRPPEEDWGKERWK